jgi:hypothetical protein
MTGNVGLGAKTLAPSAGTIASASGFSQALAASSPQPSGQTAGVKTYSMPEGETVFGQYRKAVYEVDTSIPVKEWGEWQQEFSELNPGTDRGNFVLIGQKVSLPPVVKGQQVSEQPAATDDALHSAKYD